jgi:cytochrome c553
LPSASDDARAGPPHFETVVLRTATIVVTSLLATATAGDRLRAAEPARGKAIYVEQCARCHGDAGQGVKDEYDKPLVGDKSVAELSTLIAKTMPEDDPGSCVGPDARSVAEFIYDAFYSPLAQERLRPARIELSRLTVRQHRQSLADLVGSFRWWQAWDGGGGLKGEYHHSRRFSKKDLVFDRLDGEVAFDFGIGSPDAESMADDEFAIQWTGGLLAPEAGQYEIILESANGALLWLNDMERPLIDATVRSGDDLQHRATVRLLDGRAMPLRLQYFKSRKAKEKSAAVALKWRMPHRAVEVIPARYLSPKPYPTVYVCGAAFPPDDRSIGYERGNSVSKAWEEAATEAALETAAYVTENLHQLTGVSKKQPVPRAKALEFGYRWTSRAFRRPLTSEEKRAYVDAQFESLGTGDAAAQNVAIQRMVLMTLISPRFLYQDVDKELDAYDIASRLSMGLWDSIPDDQLTKAAASGHLKSAGGVRHQAERMADDQRSRAKLRAFFLRWLKADQFTDLAKDEKRFPEFDEEFVSDLRAALDMSIDDAIFTKGGDLRQLLLADSLYMNGRLAKFYGVKLPADAPFQKVKLDDGKRAGVLTHPYLMAGLSYTSASSPIHRGVFVARNVLGRALRPPPEAVAPLPADLHANLSTRERVSLQTEAAACQSCHRMINPLGFAFENFDAVGRFRKKEQGKPIDATGLYQTRDGTSVTFANVRELATFLADSPEAHAALVEQLFHHLVKQPVRAYAPGTLDALTKSFEASGFNFRQLMIEIMVASASQPTSGKSGKTEGQLSFDAKR